MADILENRVFDPPERPEESYINPEIKPKNKAHKEVKYWYKFRTNIVMDGKGYQVTFNIRDKGKQQYTYLIEFKEDGTPLASNTVVSDLLRSTEMSHISNSIADSQPSVKERFSISGELNTQLEETELKIDEAKARRSAISEELRERYARAARLFGYTFDGEIRVFLRRIKYNVDESLRINA